MSSGFFNSITSNLLFYMTAVFFTFQATASEKYISHKDLEIYAHHPTAAALSTQLEDFARQNVFDLKNQKLISIRPQMNFQNSNEIVFVLLFLHSQKRLRPMSSLIKISGVLAKDQSYLDQLEVKEILPISKTRFSVEVSLIDLKAKVVDSVSQSVFIYPVGGSAFDEGVIPRSNGRTIFASPAFTGTLAKSVAIESRTSPSYYQGKPFLRILPKRASHSLYGFHTTPFDPIDKSKPATKLARGYISAGCLRLKDDDLIELYQLIAYGAQEGLPISIKHKVSWPEPHPYPIIYDGYHRVKAFCWKKGEGSSPCLPSYEAGARPVFSTEWVQRSPLNLLHKLYLYSEAKVTSNGFSVE